MNAKFYPTHLVGTTEAQAYKPLAMRYFALAGFAQGHTRLYMKNETEDIFALKEALSDLGVIITRDKSVYTVAPPEERDLKCAHLDVKSSQLALRFIFPLICAVYERSEIAGSGKLLKKDVTSEFGLINGVSVNGKVLPCTGVGMLCSGEYLIEPEANSNTVCALLMALALVDGDSQIKFREKLKKQFSLNIDLTITAMKEFGVNVEKTQNGLNIKGGQSYIAPAKELRVEGDFSTAGYFLAANLLGGAVKVENLTDMTAQSDKIIIKYLDKLWAGESEIALKGRTNYIFLLTALCSVKSATTTLTGVKLKEKDEQKFLEFTKTLERMGAQIALNGEKLIITGSSSLCGGGMLDTLGDARVAMTLIILSTALSSPVTILSVEEGMSEQSSFLNEFRRLGGICEVV